MRLIDDSISILNELEADAREDHDDAWEEEHMTRYWVHWRELNGTEGPRAGSFATRQEVEDHIHNELRGFAANMAHGTGVAGVATSDGRLFRDDYDIELGRFIIEEDAETA